MVGLFRSTLRVPRRALVQAGAQRRGRRDGQPAAAQGRRETTVVGTGGG